MAAPAKQYREIVYHFFKKKISIQDEARGYEKPTSAPKKIIPRQHQEQALEKWIEAGKQGVVCLPTGAGKTILAIHSPFTKPKDLHWLLFQLSICFSNGTN